MFGRILVGPSHVWQAEPKAGGTGYNFGLLVGS